MTRTDLTEADGAAEEAGGWFVRVESGEPGADAELARWLAERPEHERGMERVELAARGLVDVVVELSDGRVLVDARLRESATGATLWEARFDRPVDELRAVRDEMADNIASAMLDASLRAPVDLAEGSDTGVAASKPLQQ